LNLPVILVVGMKLGCINHALLSAEIIRCDGVDLAGWIANDLGCPMPRLADNLATLESLMPVPRLARDLCPS
jgi:dethiobiotin synthetase